MGIDRSDLRDGALVALHALWVLFATSLRAVLLAVLLMLEPLLSIMLVPLAFGSFAVTLVFGFLAGSPDFPKWQMLVFSVGCYLLYGFFVAMRLWVAGGHHGRR